MAAYFHTRPHKKSRKDPAVSWCCAGGVFFIEGFLGDKALPGGAFLFSKSVGMPFGLKKIKELFRKKQKTGSEGNGFDAGGDLSEAEIDLDGFMMQNKPYLHNRYSLYQLADETGISLSDLTRIIEGRKHSSFEEFIDGYRIRYCKKLLERIPPRTVDIFDLCIICGYTELQQFTRAFKRVMRVSVSQYIRKVNRGRQPTNGLGSMHLFFLLLLAVAALHYIKYYDKPPIVVKPVVNDQRLPDLSTSGNFQLLSK